MAVDGAQPAECVIDPLQHHWLASTNRIVDGVLETDAAVAVSSSAKAGEHLQLHVAPSADLAYDLLLQPPMEPNEDGSDNRHERRNLIGNRIALRLSANIHRRQPIPMAGCCCRMGGCQ